MLSMFSGLGLSRDGSCAAVVSTNNSAAKDLLVSKRVERQAEAEAIATQALKRQQQKERQERTKKEKEAQQPVSALRQAMDFFAQEVDERESFVSRSTRRRHKSSGKRSTTRAEVAALAGASRGRRHRQLKYNRV
ncbi:unnamed protein product [Hyaloperonospora brassicae]|uniref:Uncharacterized protein n=1 Tax=Hyaloperonospora brassicae TaxID=162125 RepID=A0AAV0TAE3_HYABA|nr:unnamed protein product [Hyaloperonospora brassicae]